VVLDVINIRQLTSQGLILRNAMIFVYLSNLGLENEQKVQPPRWRKMPSGCAVIIGCALRGS
jgi:hypothetical protein